MALFSRIRHCRPTTSDSIKKYDGGRKIRNELAKNVLPPARANVPIQNISTLVFLGLSR